MIIGPFKLLQIVSKSRESLPLHFFLSWS
uniref:Uncharacterized protein n=1 Tax=Rhizophora mucronata TaxID=61149 RepID=A0A2P2QPU7_RHIMU